MITNAPATRSAASMSGAWSSRRASTQRWSRSMGATGLMPRPAGTLSGGIALRSIAQVVKARTILIRCGGWLAHNVQINLLALAEATSTLGQPVEEGGNALEASPRAGSSALGKSGLWRPGP